MSELFFVDLLISVDTCISLHTCVCVLQVYGECEVTAYPGTQVKLQNYSCALRKGRSHFFYFHPQRARWHVTASILSILVDVTHVMVWSHYADLNICY